MAIWKYLEDTGAKGIDSMDSSALLRDLSVVVAALTAIHGISAWRREYVGKRRVDLAEEVYCLFHQARDAILAIRSPWGYGGEGGSRIPDEKETEEEKRELNKAYVTIERYQRYEDLFSRLFSLDHR